MIDVTVYYTDGCPYCVKIKKFLNDNKISFMDVNLEKDKFVVNRLTEKLGTIRLPVTQIGEEYVLGYNIRKIRELLKLE